MLREQITLMTADLQIIVSHQTSKIGPLSDKMSTVVGHDVYVVVIFFLSQVVFIFPLLQLH